MLHAQPRASLHSLATKGRLRALLQLPGGTSCHPAPLGSLHPLSWQHHLQLSQPSSCVPWPSSAGAPPKVRHLCTCSSCCYTAPSPPSPALPSVRLPQARPVPAAHLPQDSSIPDVLGAGSPPFSALPTSPAPLCPMPQHQPVPAAATLGDPQAWGSQGWELLIQSHNQGTRNTSWGCS